MPSLDERAAVRRLYDRFGWGARRSDVDDGVRRGFDACVRALLGPTGEDLGAAATPAPDVTLPDEPPTGAPRREDFDGDRTERQRRLKIWWLDRMTAVNALPRGSGSPGSGTGTSPRARTPALMLRQNETLRDQALGRFADLTRAMIADPALI